MKIPIVDIKKITKKKVLGIFNSALEIVTNDQTFYFCSIQERDTAYERIYALWKVSSPHAKGLNIEEEEENEKPGGDTVGKANSKKGGNTAKTSKTTILEKDEKEIVNQ